MLKKKKKLFILYIYIFSDFSKIFKFKFVHLGGDEVNTSKFNDLSYKYN